MSSARKRHTQSGLSLLEVLVATLVFSVGILGVAALQVSGMRVTRSAQNLNIATLIAEDVADRMRANLAGVQATNYDNVCVCVKPDGSFPNCTGCTTDNNNCPDLATVTTRGCYGAECANPSDIKAADLTAWKALMCTTAPAGASAQITCNPCAADSPRTIRVAWSETEAIEDSVTPGAPVRTTHDVTLIHHPISPHQ